MNENGHTLETLISLSYHVAAIIIQNVQNVILSDPVATHIKF